MDSKVFNKETFLQNLEYKKQQQKQLTALNVEQNNNNNINNTADTNNSNVGFMGKVYGTGRDVMRNFTTGVYKGVEGVFDLAASLIGSIGGIFDSNFQTSIADFVEKDYSSKVANWYYDNVGIGELLDGEDKIYSDYSYINETSDNIQEIVRGTVQGVGQMIPALAVGFGAAEVASSAGASASAVSTASKLGTTASFGLGAGGMGVEEALNDGANPNQALLYGTASGAVETTIEYISAGVGKALNVNVGAFPALNKVAQNTVGSLALSAVSEGAEEIASDLINPVLKASYKGKVDYSEVNAKSLFTTFTIGSLSGLVMNGSQTVTSLAKYGKEGVKLQKTLSELQDMNVEEYNATRNGTITNDQVADFKRRRLEYANQMGSSIEAMNKKYADRWTSDFSRSYIDNVEFDANDLLAQQSVEEYNKSTNSNATLEYVDLDNPEVRQQYGINTDSKVNGFKVTDKDGNTKFVINSNSKNPINVATVHEITHTLGSEYVDTTLDMIKSDKDFDYESERKKLAETYRKSKVYADMSEKQFDKVIDEEMVSNYVSEKGFKSFGEFIDTITKPSLVKKIKDFFTKKSNNAISSKLQKEYKKYIKKLSEREKVLNYSNVSNAMAYSIGETKHFSTANELREYCKEQNISTFNKISNKDLTELLSIFNNEIPLKFFELVKNVDLAIFEDEIKISSLGNSYVVAKKAKKIMEALEKINKEINAKDNQEKAEMEQLKKSREETLISEAKQIGISIESYKRLNEVFDRIEKYNNSLSSTKFSQTKGYSGNNESNRSISAKLDGKYPLSVAAKLLGVSPKTIRDNFDIVEWHHTSANMNKTYYFDLSSFTEAINEGLMYIETIDLESEIWQKISNVLNIEKDNANIRYSINETKAIKDNAELNNKEVYDFKTSQDLYNYMGRWITLVSNKDTNLSFDGNNRKSSLLAILKAFNEYDKMSYKSIVEKASLIGDIMLDNIKVNDETLKVALTEEEYNLFKTDLKAKIVESLETKGKVSKSQMYKNIISELNNEIRILKQLVAAKSKVEHKIINKLNRLKELNRKTYKESSIENEIKPLASWLSTKTLYNGYISGSIRDIIKKYGVEIYNDTNDTLSEYIDDDILNAIAEISHNADLNIDKKHKPRLTLEESNLVYKILANALHIINNYNTTILDGVKQETTKLATEEISILNDTDRFNSLGGYFRSIIDARTYLQTVTSFNEKSTVMKLFDDLVNASNVTNAYKMEFDSFFDKEHLANKKQIDKKLNTEKITFKDVEITKGVAVSIYMASQRSQALQHLLGNGIVIVDRKGIRTEINNITQEDLDNLGSELVDVEDYMEQVRKFFARTGIVYQITSENMLGFAYELDDNYFPIKSDPYEFSKKMGDINSVASFIDSNLKPSFTNQTNKQANNRIVVANVLDVVENYISQMSTYGGIVPAVHNFNKVMNKRVEIDGKKTTIRGYIATNIDVKFEKYMDDLLMDLQGIRRADSSLIDRAVGKIRGNVAKFALAANLKVTMMQLAAYPMAFQMLSVNSMAKGLTMKSNFTKMDEYCPFAKYRNYDNQAIRSMTLVESANDKVGKVSDFLMQPISKMDRFTLGLMWNACQCETERKQGLKIGTEENYKEASKLFEKVARASQPQSNPLENGSITRTNSELMKSFLMFTSDLRKYFSALYSSVNEYITAKKLIKKNRTSSKYSATELNNRLNKAKSRLLKTTSAYFVSGMTATLIGMLVKKILGKDDEDDKLGQEFFENSVVGMFPVIRDVYDYFAHDYDLDNAVLSFTNDVFDSLKGVYEIALNENSTDGERIVAWRKFVNGLGRVLGIPTKNLHELANLPFTLFDTEIGYKTQSIYYNTTKSDMVKDVDSALESNKLVKAQGIYETLMKDVFGESVKESVVDEVLELYASGYQNVTPSEVSDKVTVNGESITLTNKQIKQIQETYSLANLSIANAIDNSYYERLSDEEKAYVIKTLYNLYLQNAKASVIDGYIPQSKLAYLLNGSIDIQNIVIMLSHINSLSANETTTKKKQAQSYINSMRLSKNEKYLTWFLAGYQLDETQLASVNNYLKSTGLSKEEIETILN